MSIRIYICMYVYVYTRVPRGLTGRVQLIEYIYERNKKLRICASKTRCLQSADGRVTSDHCRVTVQ